MPRGIAVIATLRSHRPTNDEGEGRRPPPTKMIPLIASESRVPPVGKEVAELYVLAGLCKTKSEARRAIEQGAVRIDGEKILDPYARLFMVLEKPDKYYIIQRRDLSA